MLSSLVNRNAVVVAGPTCSGKSALALALAGRLNGTVINADSMQVYRELRVLTARPTPDDEARAPHALYGVRPAAEAGTAIWWRGEALAAMRSAEEHGRLPILCGGTGLYFMALSQGLAEIPDPGEAAREEARALAAELGAAGLYARLKQADPATAAKLRPNDTQRIARAWEVLRGTGQGLSAWQAQPHPPVDFPWTLRAVVLDPPRAALRAAIEGRFEAMLRQGAIEEVRSLLDQRLSPALPAMRAHGVPELSAYLRGEISLGTAAERARLVTGQYTKRQATWFRHRDIAAKEATHRLLARFEGSAQFMERIFTEILGFIRGGG